MIDTGRLRIGELCRRVGESPELLRAWEARYGLALLSGPLAAFVSTPSRTNAASGSIVLAAVNPQRFLESADKLGALAAHVRVGLGGAGASAALANRLGAETLARELADAAATLTPYDAPVGASQPCRCSRS